MNRDPYHIAFSAFIGGPIGRSLIGHNHFFASAIMPMSFGDKCKLRQAAHQHYLRALGKPEDRTGCMVLPKQIVPSTPWVSRLWSKMRALTTKPALIVWGM